MKNDVYVPSKIKTDEKNRKKNIFCWCFEGHRRRDQSGEVRIADPDPEAYQNVMDPEH
jgi:hypothetical protein